MTGSYDPHTAFCSILCYA